MKALMKYPGSKWGSADWIISHFPEHHSYLEPFFGSGGVFFNKPRSDIETINDLDGEVVNLFRQIRNDPERLAREIYFTPYSREVEVEFLEGYDSIEGPDGSMGFGVFVPTEEKIYIADDLPGGEESMIETVAHEWKHWLQYCNDEAYDEEEAEDFAGQIVEEFL